jgi:hypothetical protein
MRPRVGPGFATWPKHVIRSPETVRAVVEFILDASELLQERWLACDQEALTTVVRSLWQPSGAITRAAPRARPAARAS